VEDLAQGQVDFHVAVPTRLDDPGLEARDLERAAQAGGAAARVDDEVGIGGQIVGAAKATPRARATAARAGSVSASVTSAPGSLARSQATKQPTTPPPTTWARSPGLAAASQTAFSAVSMFAASTARPGGTPSGSGITAARGTT
jgi:hypothetical protein